MGDAAPQVGYFFRLLPPRPDFAFTLTTEEGEAMAAHAEYWRGLMEQGAVLAFGPVADPDGPFGIGIALAPDLAAAEALGAADPVAQRVPGFRIEILEMMSLVTPTNTFAAV